MGRLSEIAGVLIRHGLGDRVRRFGLADLLARAGHVLHWNHADDLARLAPPVQLRRALEELGPTFVKMAQIMAGRADLLGPKWITELAKLHSRVPAVPLDALRQQLVQDLGGEPETAFARFEAQPLAAASIAQVHRAQLHDATEVVLKIRRPGIREVIEADLRLLDRLPPMAENEWPALKPYRPRKLVRQFGQSLRRELDLASECRAAEHIAANMATLPEIVVPRVHWAWTGERLNVLDFIEGIPGEDLGRVSRAGLDRQLLGLVEPCPQAVADVLLDRTGDASGAQHGDLEDEIEAFVDQHHGTALAKLKLGQMLADVTSILREHRLALPADLALLIKAFISLAGMGRGLDPGVHMATEALPLLRQMVRARYQPKALAQSTWQALRQAITVAGRLPADLPQLLRRAREGRVQVAIEIAHLKRVGDPIDQAANRLSVSLVVAALIIGSSIVMTVGGGPKLLGLPAFGLLGFGAAALGAVWLLRSMWRGTHTGPDDDER